MTWRIGFLAVALCFAVGVVGFADEPAHDPTSPAGTGEIPPAKITETQTNTLKAFLASVFHLNNEKLREDAPSQVDRFYDLLTGDNEEKAAWAMAELLGSIPKAERVEIAKIAKGNGVKFKNILSTKEDDKELSLDCKDALVGVCKRIKEATEFDNTINFGVKDPKKVTPEEKERIKKELSDKAWEGTAADAFKKKYREARAEKFNASALYEEKADCLATAKDEASLKACQEALTKANFTGDVFRNVQQSQSMRGKMSQETPDAFYANRAATANLANAQIQNGELFGAFKAEGQDKPVLVSYGALATPDNRLRDAKWTAQNRSLEDTALKMNAPFDGTFTPEQFNNWKKFKPAARTEEAGKRFAEYTPPAPAQPQGEGQPPTTPAAPKLSEIFNDQTPLNGGTTVAAASQAKCTSCHKDDGGAETISFPNGKIHIGNDERNPTQTSLTSAMPFFGKIIRGEAVSGIDPKVADKLRAWALSLPKQ